jgi:hypothetical protein
MVTPESAGAIANPDDNGEPIAPRGRLHQVDFVSAVFHFEVKFAGVEYWKGRIAFGAVVAWFLAGKGSDRNHLAPYRDFDLIVYLEADVTLALARRHVVSGHAADTKLHVRRGWQGSQNRER